MKLQSGITLGALMGQQDISYADMAAAAGVSKGFISHLVRERKKTCTPRVADAIARRLDVPLNVLFVPSLSPVEGKSSTRQGKAVAA